LLLASLSAGIRRILRHRLLFSHFVPRPHLSHQSRKVFGTGGERSPISLVERQIFFYPRFIGSIEDRGLGEMTLTFRAFGHQQVSTARLASQHFAGRRNLEALRHSFFCFASRYGFWHREPGTYTLASSSQQEIEAVYAKRDASCSPKVERQTCTGINPRPSPLHVQPALPKFAPSFRVRVA
jgi:hypothetical protein